MSETEENNIDVKRREKPEKEEGDSNTDKSEKDFW